jgi:AcrR family transcriptional regulator
MTRQFTDERRKQQIRVAAIHCFVRHGFQATRLKDIAAEAELSKGGVYFHYRTKDALFNEILDIQLRTLEARWSFKPVADQPADRTLHRLVVAHLRTLEDEPDDTRLTHLLLGMAPQDQAFRDRLEDAFRVMRALYAGVVTRGIDDATFGAGDGDKLANCVLAMVQGLACQAALDPAGKLPVRPEDAADLVLSMLAASSSRRVGRAALDSAATVVLPA